MDSELSHSKLYTFGNSNFDETYPDVLIIGGIHGDEPCGTNAINYWKERLNEKKVSRSVGLLIANPVANEKETRYVETDLNREFTEDSMENSDNSMSLESQIATEIKPYITNAEAVLGLHSTKSTNQPFGLSNTTISSDIKRSLLDSSLTKAMMIPNTKSRGSLTQYSHVLEIECGFQQSQSATNNAIELTHEFLQSQYCLPKTSNLWSDCYIYEYIEEIPKTDEVTVLSDNFSIIDSGEIYAQSANKSYTSEYSFAPVLMSETGYEEILGVKSKPKGWLTDIYSKKLT